MQATHKINLGGASNPWKSRLQNRTLAPAGICTVDGYAALLQVLNFFYYFLLRDSKVGSMGRAHRDKHERRWQAGKQLTGMVMVKYSIFQ